MLRGMNEIKIETARQYYENEGYTNEKIGKLLNSNEASIRAMVKRFDWKRPDWYDPKIVRAATLRSISSKKAGKEEKTKFKSEGRDIDIFNNGDCWFKDHYIRDSRHILPKVKVSEA